METKNSTEIAKTETGLGAEDRLSSLPDEIISHVLSFLETKYAVGTAVLSRRWKDLWTTVPDLDFDSGLIREPERFAPDEVLERRILEFSRFVYKVLSQHKDLESVRRFRFLLSADYSELELSPSFWLEREWVFGPLVEEIDITLEVEPGFQLPHYMRWLSESFYTLKNLKVVKLQGVILSAEEGSVFLPSVKILHVCRVEIKDLESLSSLMSGCPVLETAFLEGICLLHRDERDDVLTVSLPSLKKLKIIYIGRFPIVMESPNLEELELEESVLKFMGSRPCLHSARVDIFQCPILDLIAVLNQITNAKKLFLSGRTVCHLLALDYVQFPDFPNMTHLAIGVRGSGWVLHSLLSSAPKLHSLVIDLGPPFPRMESSGWEILEHLRTPECLLSTLEEIEVKDLIGTEDERTMIAYLLKAGVVLKKVNMHARYRLDKSRKILVLLLKLPRASSACDAELFLPDGEDIYSDSYDGSYTYDDDVECDNIDDEIDNEDDTSANEEVLFEACWGVSKEGA